MINQVSRRLNKHPLALTATLGLAALGATVQANAGCMDTMFPNGSPGGTSNGLRFTPAVYRVDDSAGSFVRVSDWHEDDGIVGMWRFKMVTPGPSGAPVLVDDGYAQWHADGTEIQNSGLHAPKTSNFCLGVWVHTGPQTYQLNHFPLAWDPTGNNPAGPVQITMTVKLTDHDHFSGSYTLKVYNWDGTELINASGPPVATIKGTISAVRVTIDSTVPGSE